jgi:hypothetical protein
VSALDAAIARSTTPKEKLLIERDHTLQQLQQLEAKLRYIDTTLSDFDKEALGEDLVRKAVVDRLSGGTEWRPRDARSVAGWKFWAETKGHAWDLVEAVLRSPSVEARSP